MVPHLDELDAGARAVGAVNTVLFTAGGARGSNTDASGFARSFARGLPGARTDRVVLVGAGGAGAAVGHALLATGTGVLTVVDADPRRAHALAERLGASAGAERLHVAEHARTAEALAEADGVVHATPTGMAAHPGVAFDVGWLAPGAWVAEVVYRPLETELVRAARAAGHRVLDGGGMAVFQAVEAFSTFTGVQPDPERMLGHFRELVAGG